MVSALYISNFPQALEQPASARRGVKRTRPASRSERRDPLSCFIYRSGGVSARHNFLSFEFQWRLAKNSHHSPAPTRSHVGLAHNGNF